jgi:hypothetical protein
MLQLISKEFLETAKAHTAKRLVARLDMFVFWARLMVTISLIAS